MENLSHGSASSLADTPNLVVALPSDGGQATLRKLASSHGVLSCPLGLSGPSRQSIEILFEYLENADDNLNCSVSKIDDNSNNNESEHALFQFLSGDTPTPGLGLQGSTLLEARPMHSGDLQNMLMAL